MNEAGGRFPRSKRASARRHGLAALAAAALVLAGGARAAGPAIALTFDDLPAHGPLPAGETRAGIAEAIARAARAAGSPPLYGFVNGVQTEREPGSAAALAAWRAAGDPLGNHGWSHLGLSKIDPATFERELTRNAPLLADQRARWFRFPFLDEGADPARRDAARAILARHGYRIAAVTMSFGDYGWNEPYARCLARGDQAAIAGLERSFLAAARSALAQSRAAAQARYGRDIPYVLLMHAGAFDARMLPRLLDQYRRAGVRFTTLAAAERDPAYASDRDPRRPFDADALQHHLPSPEIAPEDAEYAGAGLASLCQ
ncbi:polysaccharide deacetylase family protein [Sphingomonas morindae]|uniref:Chitooligosaccharide deacetylase n=1 Tax=Sphingomonas morindae TaxID=1541170 RepID=A0ABY4XDH1_9SPHN|nr:polysaccharide deacetylase family protein [Sphingomonas morindae]USI75024.1 polysaccharide deacetylase family protein [Sphingomonas morindae]